MNQPFQSGTIQDVIIQPLKKHTDDRGWLCELFRNDQLEDAFHPVMAYISMTLSGVTRGPHEHQDQADYFCFLGPSNFKLYLWDNRSTSPTYRTRQVELVGQDNQVAVIIPVGIVHAYTNVGEVDGIVINCPNRLYRGKNYQEPVDEIRHEDDPDTIFQVD